MASTRRQRHPRPPTPSTPDPEEEQRWQSQRQQAVEAEEARAAERVAEAERTECSRKASEEYQQRRRDGLEPEDKPELWEMFPQQMSGEAEMRWLEDMLAAQEYEDEMFSEEDAAESESE
jgi:hypothetical protein